jgi:hypothetical protein
VRNLLRAEEALEDQKPVRVELLDLSRGELRRLDYPGGFSGAKYTSVT